MNRLSILASVLGIVAVIIGAGCASPSATPALYQLPQSSHITPLLPPPPDLHNWFASAPLYGPTPTDYEAVYQGDVTSDLTAGNFKHDTNPFCPATVTQGCPVTVTYDYTSRTTTLEFSGTLSPNISPSVSPSPSCQQPCYHFGGQSYGDPLGGAQNAYAEWTFPSSPPSPAPYINVNITHPVKRSKTWAYATVYIAASLTPGADPVFGTWDDIGYVPKGSTQPKFTFTNYGKQKLYVQSSGIILNQPVASDPACRKVNPMCAENYEILSTLNYADYPPPGNSGSQFVPLQYPPPKVLNPKGT